ncbi:MAG: hypothetical protein JNK87_08995 [Bryobacterales bacterium]|nr:hypothetical protein [Bryobacterales bacterium]
MKLLRWMLFVSLVGVDVVAIIVAWVAAVVWRWESPGTVVDPVDPGLIGEVNDEGVRGFGVAEGRTLEWRQVSRLRSAHVSCRGARLPMWILVEGGEDRAWLDLRLWGDLERARAYLAVACPGIEVEDGRYDAPVNSAWGRGSVTGSSFFGAVAGGISVMVLAWRLVPDPLAVGMVAELGMGAWVVVR